MQRKSRIVESELSDGTKIFIEAVSTQIEQDIALKKTHPFNGLGNAIGSIAKDIGDVLEDIGPTKATVEFGLEATVESGGLTALLVNGSGSATIKVTLEWDRG